MSGPACGPSGYESLTLREDIMAKKPAKKTTTKKTTTKKKK